MAPFSSNELHKFEFDTLPREASNTSGLTQRGRVPRRVNRGGQRQNFGADAPDRRLSPYVGRVGM
jgi:hypothetical protein